MFELSSDRREQVIQNVGPDLRTVVVIDNFYENHSEVKVMGPSIFESFSRCLDNALRITKGVLIGGLALFITTIFL